MRLGLITSHNHVHIIIVIINSINFTQQTKMKILYITKLVHSKSDVYYTNSLGERSGILLHNVVQSLYKNEKVNNINN